MTRSRAPDIAEGSYRTNSHTPSRFLPIHLLAEPWRSLRSSSASPFVYKYVTRPGSSAFA